MQIQEEKVRNMTVSKVPAGCSTAEYLMVLSPREDLWQTIMNIKVDFASKYRHPMACATKPHLTLLKFYQAEANENRFVKKFDNICVQQPTIKIELKDYDTFPSHTIFIKVPSKVPILNLVKALKEAQPLLKYEPDVKPFFMAEPHITIARQLVPWQHEKAWLEFSNSSFTGRFIAHKMTLLKRVVGNKHYQLVKDFYFKNLPPDVTQVSLFG